jgi:hypothetical protein
MADLSVTVRALLGKARKKNLESAGTGAAWLEAMRDEALEATLAGDEEVTSLAYEGGNSTTARRFNAQDQLEATQLALEQLTADPAGDGEASGPSFIDYSCRSAL